MAVGAIKGAMWAFVAFAFLSWILALIGLAGLQRNCYNMSNVLANSGLTTGTGTNPFSGLNPTLGLRGFNSNLGCNDVFRYYWFMFAMEFVTLVGLVTMAALGMLAASALSWMAWLTVLTVLFLQGSDSFLALKDYASSYGNALDFARLTSTGWILTALANLALIFILGWRPRKLRQGQGGPLKY